MPDIVQLKSAEQIQDDILNALASLLSITDRNIGSDARLFAYAVSLEIDALYYQLLQATKSGRIKLSSGVALENIAADYGLERKGATKSLVVVTYNGPNGVAINIGDLASKPATATEEEVVFEAKEAGVISNGTDIDIAFEAQVAGSKGNVGIDDVNFQKTPVAGATSITNSDLARGGRDRESDDELRDRILNHIESRSAGTPTSIASAALNFEQQELTLAVSMGTSDTRIYVAENLREFMFAESGSLLVGSEVIDYTTYSVDPDPATNNTYAYFSGLTRSSPQEHVAGDTVKENITEGVQKNVEVVRVVESLGHTDVYIGFKSSESPNSTLVSVLQSRLSGDDFGYNPGWRASGTTLTVQASVIQIATIAVDILVDTEFVNNTSDVQDSVKDAIIEYVNSLRNGESLTGWGIASALDIEGVQKMNSLSINGTVYDGGSAADLVVPLSTLIRTNATSITVTT